MTTEDIKAELHRLVDTLPEPELHTAQRFLGYLHQQYADLVLQALMHAPEDDEPETPQERSAAQEARIQIERGETIPDADFWQRLQHEPER